MPSKTAARRARNDLREGKAPSTAAGEFVKEEMNHIRQGKHGARSPRQAIAIGLNQARRAGVPLKPPKAGRAKAKTRQSAERAYDKGQSGKTKTSSIAGSRRSQQAALKREGRGAASHQALANHAREAARSRRRRSPAGKAA